MTQEAAIASAALNATDPAGQDPAQTAQTAKEALRLAHEARVAETQRLKGASKEERRAAHEARVAEAKQVAPLFHSVDTLLRLFLEPTV